jgi:hypothetical protein
LTFIPLILIAFLVLGAFAFVFRPLFGVKNGRWWRPDASQAALTLDELVARRDAIYAALKDVEFDQETGKLASEDYQLVRTRYMAEAAQVLRQLDRLTPEAEAALDAEIESAVAQLRSNGKQGSLSGAYPADMVEAVEAEIDSLIKRATGPDKHGLACPDCGQPYQPGDLFCPACGASLADTCPQCGASHQPEDAFCTRCGAPLAEIIGSSQ